MKLLCLLLLALAPALIDGQSLVMFGGSFDATAAEIINKIIELAVRRLLF
jgi:hypothetical protein